MTGLKQRCPNCGAENLAVSLFCDQCGKSLSRNNQSGNAQNDIPTSSGYATLLAASASDMGRVRGNNEDRVWVDQLAAASHWVGKPLGLYIVADGMGGMDGGEVASKLAVECVASSVHAAISARDVPSATEPDWGVVLKHAAQSAHREVAAARTSTANQMGTTLVMALVAGYQAFLLNVGDSRAYRVSGNGIQRLTHDDSVVQMLVDSGQIQEEETRTHPQRNLILRYLGQPGELPVESSRVDLLPGDWLLLCSDGLWEMVLDRDVEEIIRAAPTPEQACEQLVSVANAHGGEDNITVVLIQLKRDQEA